MDRCINAEGSQYHAASTRLSRSLLTLAHTSLSDQDDHVWAMHPVLAEAIALDGLVSLGTDLHWLARIFGVRSTDMISDAPKWPDKSDESNRSGESIELLAFVNAVVHVDFAGMSVNNRIGLQNWMVSCLTTIPRMMLYTSDRVGRGVDVTTSDTQPEWSDAEHHTREELVDVMTDLYVSLSDGRDPELFRQPFRGEGVKIPGFGEDCETTAGAVLQLMCDLRAFNQVNVYWMACPDHSVERHAADKWIRMAPLAFVLGRLCAEFTPTMWQIGSRASHRKQPNEPYTVLEETVVQLVAQREMNGMTEFDVQKTRKVHGPNIYAKSIYGDGRPQHTVYDSMVDVGHIVCVLIPFTTMKNILRIGTEYAGVDHSPKYGMSSFYTNDWPSGFSKVLPEPGPLYSETWHREPGVGGTTPDTWQALLCETTEWSQSRQSPGDMSMLEDGLMSVDPDSFIPSDTGITYESQQLISDFTANFPKRAFVQLPVLDGLNYNRYTMAKGCTAPDFLPPPLYGGIGCAEFGTICVFDPDDARTNVRACAFASVFEQGWFTRSQQERGPEQVRVREGIGRLIPMSPVIDSDPDWQVWLQDYDRYIPGTNPICLPVASDETLLQTKVWVQREAQGLAGQAPSASIIVSDITLDNMTEVEAAHVSRSRTLMRIRRVDVSTVLHDVVSWCNAKGLVVSTHEMYPRSGQDGYLMLTMSTRTT